jgi:two-component system, cell cycle sensor histidine kinase and response regulator CckA
MKGDRADESRGARVGARAREADTIEGQPESEQQYRSLYRHTPAMMHSIDRAGRIVSVSALWLASMGYEESEVIGRRSVEFLTEASRTYAETVVLPAFFRTGSCTDVPYELIRKDGSIMHVLLSAIAERDASGAVVRSLAVLVDVTERERALRALHQSEQRYQDLVNGVEGIVWEAAAEGLELTFVSQRAERILGYPAARWREEPGFWVDHVHPDDRATLRRALEAAMRGEGGPVEYRMIAADGGTVWLRDDIAAVPSPEGPRWLRGVMIDISDLKRAQARIEESERRYRQFFRSAGVALWDIDYAEVRRFLGEIAPSGADELRRVLEAEPEQVMAATSQIRVDEVNAETLRLFGAASKEELLGALTATLVAESHYVLREHLLAHAEGQPRFSSEAVVKTLQGERRHIVITSVIPHDDSGHRALVSTLDVTERKDLEAQLRHAQKMEAVGQLAGGIAHDFNNFLAVILGRSEILAKLVPQEGELQSHLALIRETVEQASQLTLRLLAFSRRQVLQPQTADLNAIVEDTVNMLRRLIGESVSIELGLADDLELVRVDPGQIGQVVVNLALNARDAMPSGGRLVIETCNRLDGGVPSVVLTMRDDGHGMDEATRARIFEPFFTTKAAGHGTGLGLATVYGIVEQSGGTITVDSAPGGGTTFEVFLPRAEGTRTAPPARDDTEPVGGSETVLLTEDEAPVRRVTAEILRDYGYRVLTAADATDALAVARAHEGAIHLLLSDVVMPGANGPTLAAELRGLRPETRCLFMSGYLPALTDLEGAPLLRKPFAARALLAAVRDALDREA